MTTHFMVRGWDTECTLCAVNASVRNPPRHSLAPQEEADALGDRIAIMSKGTIKCMGTSLELKSSLGLGYHLSVVKSEAFDAEGFNRLLHDHFGTSRAVGCLG